MSTVLLLVDVSVAAANVVTMNDQQLRRRWIQRVRNLLGQPAHVVVEVHRGAGTVGVAVAGGPTVSLDPDEVHRLRGKLADAAAQALADRGGQW
ncbi:hypothetical protein [Pseudonocardia alni]|uniref:hypothetical protein n=1 Tax=Pseudonocardia alni TaxID=33907 RepID=UPI0033C743E5